LTTTEYLYFHPTTNHDASSYTYDKAGNLVLIETDSDAVNADGTSEYRSITTITNLNEYQTYKVTSVESLPDEVVIDAYTEIETFDEQRNLVRDEIEYTSPV